MKSKLFLSIILLCIASVASAQMVAYTGASSTNSPITKTPKPNTRNPFMTLHISHEQPGRLGLVTATDSTFNALRFDAGTGYSYPDGNVQAGIGFGVHHIKYTYATQAFYTQWSAVVYIWAGGNVAPVTASDVVKISAMVGVLNGAIQVGPYYSIGVVQLKPDGSKISKFGVMVITSLNFKP